MTIYPKYDQTLYGVFITKTNPIYTFALISVGFFLFFSFFSSKLSTWSTCGHHYHYYDPLGSTTSHGTILTWSTHLALGLVPRFHQLSKTKLGLSARQAPWCAWPSMRPRASCWQSSQCALPGPQCSCIATVASSRASPGRTSCPASAPATQRKAITSSSLSSRSAGCSLTRSPGVGAASRSATWVPMPGRWHAGWHISMACRSCTGCQGQEHGNRQWLLVRAKLTDFGCAAAGWPSSLSRCQCLMQQAASPRTPLRASTAAVPLRCALVRVHMYFCMHIHVWKWATYVGGVENGRDDRGTEFLQIDEF